MSCDSRVTLFEYPAVRETAGDDGLWTPSNGADNSAEQQLREAKAREVGRMEGENTARSKYEDELRKQREKLAESVQQFQAERNSYFENIESEVVQLALAVARRILHREANVDPELLAGLVRYTLEKLRDGTRVKIRVNPAESATMQKQFGMKAEVIADSSIAEGSCVLVTEIGTTAISVDEQLKEIECGLMDLLAQRPAVHP